MHEPFKLVKSLSCHVKGRRKKQINQLDKRGHFSPFNYLSVRMFSGVSLGAMFITDGEWRNASPEWQSAGVGWENASPCSEMLTASKTNVNSDATDFDRTPTLSVYMEAKIYLSCIYSNIGFS